MKRILCYGDSNTWGYTPGTSQRLPHDVRWTGVLQKELGGDYTVVEEGLSGRNTVYSESGVRCGIDYLLPCLVSQKPIDAVVLMLGTNDLRWTDARGAAEGVRRIIAQLYAAGELTESSDIFIPKKPRILLVSPIHAHEMLNQKEPGDYHIGYPEKSLEFARYYEKLAQETGCAFLDAALYAEPSIIDGMHMTLESHPRFGKAVADKVRGMLEK